MLVFYHMHKCKTRGMVAGEGARDHARKFSRNRQIFGNFDALSEKFLSSAMGKEKGFEFYRRVIELGPLLYMCTTPLCKTEHESYTKMKL